MGAEASKETIYKDDENRNKHGHNGDVYNLSKEDKMIINSLIQIREDWNEKDVINDNTDEIWHLLVEYAASYLPINIQVKWNIKEIKKIILNISKNGILKQKILKKCKQRLYLKSLLRVGEADGEPADGEPADGEAADGEGEPEEAEEEAERRKKKKILEKLQKKQPFFPNLVLIPYHYASYLLKIDENLHQMRFELVPQAHIVDQEFWSIYFATIVKKIKAHIIRYANFVKNNESDESDSESLSLMSLNLLLKVKKITLKKLTKVNLKKKLNHNNNRTAVKKKKKKKKKSIDYKLKNGWKCKKCGLRNAKQNKVCALCNYPKPK